MRLFCPEQFSAYILSVLGVCLMVMFTLCFYFIALYIYSTNKICALEEIIPCAWDDQGKR